jgi:hypothetical protein
MPEFHIRTGITQVEDGSWRVIVDVAGDVATYDIPYATEDLAAGAARLAARTVREVFEREGYPVGHARLS